MQTKKFPTEVVVSITSGVLLCDFDKLHEAVEWLVGHQVWTHELASGGLNDKMKQMLLEQHPQLSTMDIQGMSSEEVPDCVDKLRRHFGSELEIKKGEEQRTQEPIETLKEMCPDKPVIVVVPEQN
jgi:hypothetical protein